MKLPDSVYTVLKWLVCICIPAITTAYVGLCAVWTNVPFFQYADPVAKTSAVVCTLLGALIGISTAEYNRTINKDK